MSKAQAMEIIMLLWFMLCLLGKQVGMPLWWTISLCIMAVWRGLCVVKGGGA